MKPLKTLWAVLLVGWVTGATAMPPMPDIRGWLVTELQKAHPDTYPGQPVRLASGEYSAVRFSNGNVLAFSEYMLFMASPQSSNSLVPLDSQIRLRCVHKVFIDPARDCATPHELLSPSGRFLLGQQAKLFLFRSAADMAQQLPGQPAAIAPRLATVDWTRQMVVGVAMGHGDAPCSVVSILNIRDLPVALEVDYLVHPPPPVPGVASACNYPQAAFAIVARSAKPVAYKQRLTRPPWELPAVTLP